MFNLFDSLPCCRSSKDFLIEKRMQTMVADSIGLHIVLMDSVLALKWMLALPLCLKVTCLRVKCSPLSNMHPKTLFLIGHCCETRLFASCTSRKLEHMFVVQMGIILHLMLIWNLADILQHMRLGQPKIAPFLCPT